MRVDCSLLTIHSFLIGPKQTVDAWSLSNLRKQLGIYRLIQLVPVSQVLTITGTVPAEKQNARVRRAFSRSGN